jgi:hypothetical protein
MPADPTPKSFEKTAATRITHTRAASNPHNLHVTKNALQTKSYKKLFAKSLDKLKTLEDNRVHMCACVETRHKLVSIPC